LDPRLIAEQAIAFYGMRETAARAQELAEELSLLIERADFAARPIGLEDAPDRFSATLLALAAPEDIRDV
jgi:hypothetical protein